MDTDIKEQNAEKSKRVCMYSYCVCHGYSTAREQGASLDIVQQFKFGGFEDHKSEIATNCTFPN